MISPGSKISYHKSWSLHVPGLKLVDFADDFNAFVIFDKEGFLRLYNNSGTELWSRKSPHKLVSVSLAGTLEVLAVDEEKHSVFFGHEGVTLWRKRPFPAAFARISGNAEVFSFVTTDPAIIGADRSLKVQWAYRNLMKRPEDLAIAADASVIAFPCCDDRGEGVGAVNQSGKPYDAFMGIEGVHALDLSSDGQRVLVLGDRGRVFCIDLVKGRGVWKGKLDGVYHGISYADQTGDSIAFSLTGRVVKFDSDGNHCWEYFFPERLLKARISHDGNSFYYATERGEIGLMTPVDESQNGGSCMREVEVKPLPADARGEFKKVWNIELSGKNSNQSIALPWKGQEGVEYCLVWDGTESLFCINDLAEEVWKVRLSATNVVDMSVSSEADMAAIVTKGGVAGYDLAGEEVFKFFGQFKLVHIFNNSSMILTDIEGKCRFYQSFDHFSHFIDTEDRVRAVFAMNDRALIQTSRTLMLIDPEGNVEKIHGNEHEITFINISCADDDILMGDTSGKAVVFDCGLSESYSYEIDEPVRVIAKNSVSKTLFLAGDSKDIHIINREKREKIVNRLTGRPIFAFPHELGAILATDLDQLGLINSEGQIIARYTSPYSFRQIFPSHRRMSLLVLADEALSCIAAVAGGA